MYVCILHGQLNNKNVYNGDAGKIGLWATINYDEPFICKLFSCIVFVGANIWVRIVLYKLTMIIIPLLIFTVQLQCS